jgi:hypothetical protein
MYGPASGDLVSAKMADHHRYAKKVALENAARHSLRTERPPKRSWFPEFVSFATSAAGRLGQLRRKPSVQTPVVVARLKGATS